MSSRAHCIVDYNPMAAPICKNNTKVLVGSYKYFQYHQLYSDWS